MQDQKQQIEYAIQQAQQRSTHSAQTVQLIAVTKTLTPEQTKQNRQQKTTKKIPEGEKYIPGKENGIPETNQKQKENLQPTG